MINDKTIEVKELAVKLGVSQSTIYRWFWEGKLRGVKFRNSKIKILQSSVDEIMDKLF